MTLKILILFSHMLVAQATLALSPDDENNLVYMFSALDRASNTFNLINHIKALSLLLAQFLTLLQAPSHV